MTKLLLKIPLINLPFKLKNKIKEIYNTLAVHQENLQNLNKEIDNTKITLTVHQENLQNLNSKIKELEKTLNYLMEKELPYAKDSLHQRIDQLIFDIKNNLLNENNKGDT